MRILPFLLLAMGVSTASAGTFPISSFAPDTTTKHASRDTVDRPVWFGLQASPFAGGSHEPGQVDVWDTNGTPWVGMRAAWPQTSPGEAWLAIGYEHWSFALKSDTLLFAPGLLPYVSPRVLDLLSLRVGADGLIYRDHVVSGAIGVGGGTGFGTARIPVAHRNVVPLELLAHAFVYVRAGGTTRIGIGASGGETWLLSDGEISYPFVHWEFALRLEQAMVRGGKAR